MKRNIEGSKGGGNWYKGSLHNHTVNFDGRLTPAESVKLSQDNGYHFLYLSEHDLCIGYRKESDSPGFIIPPGLEASAVLFEKKDGIHRKKVHHTHGILGTELIQQKAVKLLLRHMERLEMSVYHGEWDGAAVAQQLVDELAARGCITTYNYLVWFRVEEREFVDTDGIFGLEIFNYNTVSESGTGHGTAHRDVMLRKGRQIHGLASDDNHNEGLFDDACSGYAWVKVDGLTHDNIISALVEGSYYSSSGPEIYDWGIRGGVAYVDCSPVNRISVTAGGYVNGGRTVMCGSLQETMTQVEYPLNGDETCVRVECVDASGRTAWSNAIFLQLEMYKKAKSLTGELPGFS